MEAHGGIRRLKRGKRREPRTHGQIRFHHDDHPAFTTTTTPRLSQLTYFRIPRDCEQEEKAAAEAKEEEALDQVKARVGPRLDQWANDPSTSKLRNVRTLLSTMHTVLWEGTHQCQKGEGPPSPFYWSVSQSRVSYAHPFI